MNFKGTAPSISKVVKHFTNIDANKWDGSYIINAFCRAGELIVISQLLPSLRERIPKAKIYIKVLEEYSTVPEGFDGVITVKLPKDLIRWSNNELRGGYHHFDNHISVSAFRAHWWFLNDTLCNSRWYVNSFADAIGASREIKSKIWPSDKKIALAFPTLNSDSSVCGKIKFTPEQWAEIGGKLVEKGYKLLATGRLEDGSADMPGWEWLDMPLQPAIDLLKSANFVIGGQSGMPMASGLFGSGYTVILDDSLTLKYFLDNKNKKSNIYTHNEYLYDPIGHFDQSRSIYHQVMCQDDVDAAFAKISEMISNIQ